MVVGGLRDAILSGVLAGGQPLRQDEIAEHFGVSRMPVREALRQLEGEGMVSFYPHRGAVVSELSYREVLDIIEIRISLETMALHKAFPLLGDDEFRRAEEVLHSIEEDEDLVRYLPPGGRKRCDRSTNPAHSRYRRDALVPFEVLRPRQRPPENLLRKRIFIIELAFAVPPVELSR